MIYEIYVTPFLNKVRMNMFTAFVVCNLDKLCKKLEILLHLFFQEIVRDSIHSSKIEANQFRGNKPGIVWLKNFMKRNRLSHKKSGNDQWCSYS